MVAVASVVSAIASVATAHASPAQTVASDVANQIVFVGLLPLDKAGGTGDLVGPSAAQDIRVVVEAALADLSRHPVSGHQALTARLGSVYLQRWFDCRSDADCQSRVLAPMRSAGHVFAISGDYYIQENIYHIRLTSLILTGGAGAETIAFALSAAEVLDRARWLDRMRPLLASRTGRVRIVTNVDGCTLDGEPCRFDPDGQTLAAMPGDHALVLSRDGYKPETRQVTIATGLTQEVAIAWTPLPPASREPKIVVTSGPQRRPVLGAVRTDARIEIDGILDDTAWSEAWVEANFTQSFPDEAKPPSERTELRVLYDDDALYLSVRCYDSQPQAIVSRLTRRDRDIEADKVTIDISSKNDRTTSFTFQVNAAGVQLDGTRFADTSASTDWDGVWYAATTRDDKGWIAELEIPLATLRYNGDATSFGFQVRRYIQRRQEIVEWSYVPRDARGEVSNYGTLDGLNGLSAKRLLQIIPYALRHVTVRRRQGTLDDSGFGASVGADLRLGITPGLTLAATVFPDFGTVEVDQVVLNLSTFETFFPEKRPFFLEGADIFDTASQNGVILGVPSLIQFYSRRVGRTPPSTAVDGALVEPPPFGEVLAAAKISGSLAHRMTIGAIAALTAREDVEISRTSGVAPERVLVDPLTNFGVLRLRQEFGVNSSIGILATSVNRFEPAGAATPQPDDTCPRARVGVLGGAKPLYGRCTNDAYTAGLDTVHRTGSWGASGQVVGSVLDNGPARVSPDGSQIRPGDLGWGVSAEAGKYSGDLLYALHYAYLNPQLELNDAGFNARANVQQLKSRLVLRRTSKFLWFHKAELRLIGVYENYADTHARSSANVSLVWEATLRNFWQSWAACGPVMRAYNNRETRDGALLQTPRGFSCGMTLRTDPREPVIVTANVDPVIKTLRGIGAVGRVTVSLRPTSYLELDVISNATWSYGDPRWVTTTPEADGSRTYYFQDLDSRSWDLLLRGTWTLSPTLSLQTYAQLYLDSGHYGTATAITASGTQPRLDIARFAPTTAPAGVDPDFRHSALNVNAFLRWEFRPGSAFWVVYTRNQINRPFDSTSEGAGRLRIDKLDGPSTDVLLVKLSYLWEPLSRRR